MNLLEGEVVTTDISTVLQSLSAVFTWLMNQVGQVFNVIQSYPIALIPIGVSIAFIAVRFTKRILGI